MCTHRRILIVNVFLLNKRLYCRLRIFIHPLVSTLVTCLCGSNSFKDSQCAVCYSHIILMSTLTWSSNTPVLMTLLVCMCVFRLFLANCLYFLENNSVTSSGAVTQKCILMRGCVRVHIHLWYKCVRVSLTMCSQISHYVHECLCVRIPLLVFYCIRPFDALQIRMVQYKFIHLRSRRYNDFTG